VETVSGEERVGVGKGGAGWVCFFVGVGLVSGREERGKVEEELIESLDGLGNDEGVDALSETGEGGEGERMGDGGEGSVESVEDGHGVDDHVDSCMREITVDISFTTRGLQRAEG